MLHEVLFALLGHHGDMIVKRDDQFCVASDVNFIHASERIILDNIVKLGYMYHKIDQFCTVDCVDSPYVRVLRCGMQQLLDEYRATIVSIEQRMLDDPHLPLAFLQEVLAPKAARIEMLDSLVKEANYLCTHA